MSGKRAISQLVVGTLLAAAPLFAESNDENYQYAAALMGERGEYAAAAEKFSEFAAAAPGDAKAPQALYYLANCHIQLKNDKAAAESYAKLVKLYPAHPLAAEAAANGADAFFRCGQPARAEELYSSLLTLFPKSSFAATAHYWRAESRLRLAAAAGEKTAAGEWYRKAQEDFTVFARSGHKLVPDALLSAGLAAFDRHDYSAAAASLTRFTQEFPGHSRSEDAWYYLAESRYWQENYEAADTAYAAFLEKFPQGTHAAAASAGRGWCAYMRKERRAAAEFFAAAALKHQDPAAALSAHFDAGTAYAEAGDSAAAVKEFTPVAAAENHPRTLAALLRLGTLTRAEERAGNNAAGEKAPEASGAKAEVYFARALRLAGNDPAGAEAAAFLGECCLERGDAKAAAAALKEGLTKWPSSPVAARTAYHLALAQSNLQEPAAAAETVRTLLQKYPESHLRLSAAYLLADCQKNLGNGEKARAAWRWLADEGKTWAAARQGADRDAVCRQAADLAARALLDLGESYYSESLQTAAADADAAGRAAWEFFTRLQKEYPAGERAALAGVRLGEIREKDGDYQAAAAAYTAALAAVPPQNSENASAVRMHAAYRLGVAAVLGAPAGTPAAERTKAMTEASRHLTAFRRDYENNPEAAVWRNRALYYLAEAEYALGRRQEAAAAYEECYRAAPRDTLADAALFGMAWCAREKGEGTAEEYWRRLITEFPRSEYCGEAMYALCLQLQAAEKYPEALALAQRLQKEFPRERCRAGLEEGKILDLTGKSEEAEKILAELLAGKDLQGEARAAGLQALSRACWSQAEPLFKQADAAGEKLKTFLAGQRLRDLPPEKKNEGLSLRKDWMTALSAAREVENRMVAALEKLVAEFPQYPGRDASLLRLGEAAYERNSLSAAEKYYRAALEADSSEKTAVADKAHYRLGWCALRQSEKADGTEKASLRAAAAKEFAIVAEKYGNSPLAGESAWQAAELLRTAGEYEKALALYGAARNAASADIRDGAAYARGACLLELKKYREAYEEFKTFLAAGSKELSGGAVRAWAPEASWGAGHAALMLGAYDEARDYFLAAKANNYGGEAAAKARYGLGMIEFEQGRWKTAREEFRKVEVFHAAWPEVAALALVKAAAASQELGEAASAAKDLQRVVGKYGQTAAVNQARELLAKTMDAGEKR